MLKYHTHMSSNLKKIIIIAAVIFSILLSFLTGIVFFLKKENKDIPSQNNEQEEQRSKNSEKTELTKKEELTEKEKTKIFAENFAMIYYSYTWGNFSNIESQYHSMAEEMKNKEKNRVERMKKEIEDQPRKYFSAKARLTDSTFLLYNGNRAEMIINLNIDNFAGAIIQRETIIWVDEKGDPYIGDVNNLITSSKNKKIKIDFIKINDEWKISGIENIDE